MKTLCCGVRVDRVAIDQGAVAGGGVVEEEWHSPPVATLGAVGEGVEPPGAEGERKNAPTPATFSTSPEESPTLTSAVAIIKNRSPTKAS